MAKPQLILAAKQDALEARKHSGNAIVFDCRGDGRGREFNFFWCLAHGKGKASTGTSPLEHLNIIAAIANSNHLMWGNAHLEALLF
jgi:hypothetical protein